MRSCVILKRQGPHQVAQKSTTSKDTGDFVAWRSVANSLCEFTVLIRAIVFSASMTNPRSRFLSGTVGNEIVVHLDTDRHGFLNFVPHDKNALNARFKSR